MKRTLGILLATVGLLLPLLSLAQNQRSDDGDRRDREYSSNGRWEGRLSAEDQGRFDNYYSRWLNYRRTNNREETSSMENRMREVMSHYSIPSDVPFDQIASNNQRDQDAARRGDRDRDDYREGQRDDGNRQWRSRLSGEDQSRFDSYYSRWLNYKRTNNRKEASSMEKRMREVMAHNSIPANTEFSQLASPSASGNTWPRY